MVRSALVAVALAAVAAGCGRAAPKTTTIAPPHQFHILFPEGFTRAQMAARVNAVAQIADGEKYGRVKISERAYLAATSSRIIAGFGTKKLQMEGFLFPNTYNFDTKSTSPDLVHVQLQTFYGEWRKVDMSYAVSKNLTPYDVLKIASMIQAESGTPGDNKLVAAVIYNRLHRGMPLQIDATVRYGFHLAPGAPITQSELDSDNPYNTRKLLGLPPTPIDNPGVAAIQAAAHPAHVNYLSYLKIPNSKRSYFTASYPDFENHKAQYGY